MSVCLGWHNPRMDRVYYEDIGGRLRGLLIRLEDRLPAIDVALIAEFVDANELGLALEQIKDVLSAEGQPLAPDERADILALAERMQMGDSVLSALRLCPER